MIESVQSIADWHKETFPDATYDGQMDKATEEMMEFAKSGFKDITELADMYIVACGLIRFTEPGAMMAFGATFSFFNDMFKKDPKTLDKLEAAVDAKMKKNRKRVWKKTSEGAYHHTNED